MRKITGLSVMLCLSLALAACGAQSAAAPTNAPTAAPLVLSTEGPAASSPQSAASDLSGSWQWVQAVDASGVSTNVADSARFGVSFDPASGTVGITTACQGAQGTYVTDGSTLTIKVASMTRVICPNDTLSSQFIIELGSAQSYRLDGGQLVLKLGGDGGSLRLTH